MKIPELTKQMAPKAVATKSVTTNRGQIPTTAAAPTTAPPAPAAKPVLNSKPVPKAPAALGFADPVPSAAQQSAPTASQPTDNLFGDLELPPAVVPPTPVAAASQAVPGTQAGQSAGLTPKPRINLSKVIAQQLSERLKVRGCSFGYRLAMMLVSLFMLAMPLAYVALVAATCWGVFHYTFDVFPELLSAGRVRSGRVMLFLMMLYVTPIIAGITTIIFMIKPIFVSLVGLDNERRRSLTREGEPLLFDLVDRICEATGSPKPKRIDVNAEPNASASYGAGFRAIFRRELILTIGVPLVAGLNTRQFVGVLTHEFGHFSQGAGMRARIIIMSINAWFAKVVYHRDAIDETLDDMIEDSESAFVFVLLIAKFCVMLVRGVLWCFMFAAHVASSILSRQMEFDADKYEIGMVGSETFAKTEGEFHLMGYSFGKAMNAVGELLQKSVMIDDLPRMVQVCRTQISAGEKQQLWESLTQATTGVFDSHPSPRSRIAAAQKQAADGMFTLERPARELFQHYNGMCQNVTQDFYRNAIGQLVNPSEMEPVDRHLHLVLAKRKRSN